MVDITRNSTYNQKRESRFMVADVTEAEILAIAGVGNLPERSVVLSVKVIVKTVSTTLGANVSLLAGVTPIATNMAVTVAGVIHRRDFAPVYLPTGGAITIVGGAVPPAAANLASEYLIEYIELDRLNGEYTA